MVSAGVLHYLPAPIQEQAFLVQVHLSSKAAASFLVVQLATRGAALTTDGFYARERFVATMHFS